MSIILETKGLCKYYGLHENVVKAVDHMNLRIEQGEFVTIIGKSGSGKSTLLHLLGGLDNPTSGEVWLDGKNIAGYSEEQLAALRRREIGFIFQGFNLIQNLTAVENVTLPLIYRGVGKKERQQLALSALEKVGLAHSLDHKPAEMSGGQQQRVAIARAIAQAPPIILADEPTGNLDSSSTKEIMQILRELHSEGRTVILITHDNEIAEQADRIIKIRDGKIVSDTGMENHETMINQKKAMEDISNE